ncbi:MAG: leucine-rich repeat protein [Firmicutes bacterium]|nr:leucine-rich repeat protein [Bacillota bacterium]
MVFSVCFLSGCDLFSPSTTTTTTATITSTTTTTTSLSTTTTVPSTPQLQNYATIVFHSNGGSSVDSIIQPSGTGLSEPSNPIKDGYQFDGWYTDVALTNQYVFSIMPSGDIDLYASWSVIIVQDSTDDYIFMLNANNQYVVAAYVGTKTELIIPSSYLGIPVVGIRQLAFYRHSDITQISIPDCIIEIQSGAFYQTSITNLIISEFVTTIQNDAFYGMDELETISVSNQNPNYISIDNILFSKDMTTLIKYAPKKTSISYEIPNSVEIIATGAFENATTLIQVTFEPTSQISEIQSNTFAGMTSLTSIIIPSSVTKIGFSAFSEDSALSSVVFETGSLLSMIDVAAFSDNSSLTTLHFPSGVNYFGFGAFTGTTSLSSITVDASNTTFTSLDGVLFLKDMTGLCYYPEGKSESSYVIPSQVTSIRFMAFENSPSASLKTISFSPASLITEISYAAFSGSESVENVIIPNTVTTIKEEAFYGMTNLSEIVIPSSVTSIEISAFEKTTSLASVTFSPGSQLTSIGTNAFYGASALTSIVIPSSVNSIARVFLNATSLETIVVDPLNLSYSSLDGVLYNYDKSTLITYPEGKTDTSFTVPSTVSRINEFAFYHAIYLENIDFEFGCILTGIGNYAFYKASALQSIFIQSTVTEMGYNAFDDASSIKINVQAASQPLTWASSWNIDQYDVEWNYSSGITSTITFEVNGGLLINPITQDVGTVLDRPSEPIKDGCRFMGWYEDSTFGVQFSFSVMPLQDITIYAKWELNQYVLEFIDLDGNVIQSTNYDFGQSLALHENPSYPPKLGYSFSGWDQSLPLTMPAEDVLIYPTYTINQYTISFDENDGSLVLDITQDYKTPTTKPEDPVRTGYVFFGWGITEGQITTYTFTTMPAEDITLYAIWRLLVADDPIYYNFSLLGDGTYQITAYKGSFAVPIIPSTYLGIPVTSIGYCAFFQNSNITKVVFLDDSQLTRIETQAFLECTNLTSFIIPSTVIYIGANAFGSCSNLPSIIIPSSVLYIDEYVFQTCIGLTSITVDAANPNYSSENGVLFNKDQSMVIYYPSNKAELTYTIPSSVTTINENAFRNAIHLTSVTIHENVTSIGLDSFANCSSLTSITVDGANPNYSSENGVLFNKQKTIIMIYPKGKTETSYVIPSSVTSIEDYAFYSCENLTTVTIPDGVESIGFLSFAFCNGLTNLTFPSNLISISNLAFLDCVNLVSITIPLSVTSIGAYAFDNCDSLTIHVEATTLPSGWSFDWNPDICPVIWG